MLPSMLGKLLLFFHLVGAFVLVGSLTHNLVIVVNYLKNKFEKTQRAHLYTKIALITYAFEFVIGALIYPSFRVHVRAEYFDLQLPWATGLFEVKEHWAAIGLALMIVYHYVGKNIDFSEVKKMTLPYLILGIILFLTIWYLIGAGFYLTTLKSI